MRSKTIISICSLMFAAACVRNPAPAEPEFHMDTFFPLMAWDDVRNEATIRKMAECGINSIAFVPPEWLDACQKYGVKAILFDQRITPDWDKPFDSAAAAGPLEELIGKYNSHPAVYGYHLKDEPYIGEYEELARSVELVEKLAPGKWPYINLFPNYGFPGTGEWYADEYLQRFVDVCKGPIICWDNYSLKGEKGFSDDYWTNLWDGRAVALRNGLPFQTIVLAVGYHGTRIPTAADLSLQVYGALAYGAKGIGYWKFVSEVLQLNAAPELGNLRGSPLDEFGGPGAMYPLMRNLNHRISNLAPVLLRLRSDDVYHIGGDIPEKHHGATPQSTVREMKYGGQFIIGEFTHTGDGSKWVMIVNKSLEDSSICIPVFDKQYEQVRFLSTTTGELKPFDVWYALSPGQGVLLKLE